MKKYSIIKLRKIGFALFGLLFVPACQNDDSDLRDIDATVSQNNNPDVFMDTFSSGLDYAAFAGSDLLGFQVDNKVSYNGSAASMRFDVPNVGDPDGGFTGGVFFSTGGRNLTGYNVLTFWAKGLEAATVEIGYGLSFTERDPETQNLIVSEDYKASCTQKISTTWKKYYIPIPDASKLKSEKGLLYVSAGAKNTDGYTFWLDEVKYEKLDDIILQEALINSGKNTTKSGPAPLTIAGLTTKYSLPNGGTQVVNTAPNYYDFSSDNEDVVRVTPKGVVEKLIAGTATITAKLGDVSAVGSIQVISTGAFVFPSVPTRNAADVVSVFSDYYQSINVDFFNGYWQPYQTTLSNDFEIKVGDKVDKFLNYTNFNFVGHQFSNPTQDLSQMTHLHFDMYIPGSVPSNFDFLITVVDFGPDGQNSGNDNTRKQLFVPKSDKIKANEWLSIDIPLDMSTKNRVGLVIYENINLPKGPGLSEFYMDNVYFFKQ